MTRRFVCAASCRCASRDSYLPLSELYSNSVTVRCTSVQRRRPSAFVLHCAQAWYSGRRFPRSHYNPPAIHFRAIDRFAGEDRALRKRTGLDVVFRARLTGPTCHGALRLFHGVSWAPEHSNSMPHMRRAPATIDFSYCFASPVLFRKR